MSGWVPPPALIAAEKAVVGAAMRDREDAETLGAIVKPEWFARPQHGLIFAAVMALAGQGGAVDPAAVVLELTRNGNLRPAGEAIGVFDCFAAAPADATWHARQVAGDYRRRAALERLTSAVQMLESPSFETPGLEQIRVMVDEVLAPTQRSSLRDMPTLIADTIDGLERKDDRGLTTGIVDLDYATGGLKPGTLTLIAARPGIGKSVLLAGISAHVAENLKQPVLLPSLEMSAEMLTMRLLSSRGRVNLHALVNQQMTTGDWDQVARAADRLSACPLLIDDTPGVPLGHLRSRLREMDRTAPAALLAVDYLQLMEAPKAENRQVAVSELAWGLRQIARERKIPVLVACQLNRGPEHRTDKRPMLSDLRESGALEMHADTVILLHREDAYNRESPRAGEIDLILDKNRQGPQCCITAAFQGHYSRVVDMAPSYAPDPPVEGS